MSSRKPDNDKKSRTWEFTTRLDRSGYPTVVPIQPLHYPPNIEFDDIPGLQIPPPPVPTPRGQSSDEDIPNMGRRLTVTPRQIVNRMNMLEAFSDAVSRTYRPHSDTVHHTAPNPDATFATYIPFPYDFEVIPDPMSVKHTWVQTVSDYLFYACGAGVIFNASIFSLTLFATFFVADCYAKELLKMILEEGTYVNIYVFVSTHLVFTLLFILFLCYPHREKWGRFHKMRWIPMGMTNMILVVAILDQFYWLTNFTEVGKQLKENMAEGLDVTQNSLLVHTSQGYFQCCGVDGYRDWTPLLKDNKTLYYGGYPKSCCSDTYIKSCHIPVNETVVMEPSMKSINQLWPTGCYDHELYFLHVTIILIWIAMLFISFTSVGETLVLWWIIRHICIHDIKTDHPFK